MRRISQPLVLLSFSFIFLTSCIERGTVDNKSDGQPQPYPSSGEAVLQGKRDLLELLNSRKDLNLGVEPSQVERAQPEQGLNVFEVDFQKLLEAGDDVSGLDKIAGATKGNTTPLSVDNQVIGIVDTRQDADGWRVSALSNQVIKKDLNEIRKSRADSRESKMSYFEVPNIHARIYSVSVDGQERYLTNYEGFSFDKPVRISELLPKLKGDAQSFEKLYGEALRTQQLVK